MLIKFPFFEGHSPDEMIAQVASLCGTVQLLQYVDKYGLNLSQDALSLFPTNQSSGWLKYISLIKPAKYDEDAIRLLRTLLTIDHAERISAAEALKHPFFDPIRKNMERGLPPYD